ncbi:TPA: hypothetical protein ACN5QQ_002212 [Citrobacter freundii]
MSTITKQAVQAVADLKAGYTLGHADVEIIQQMALDAVTLLDELEARDKSISFLKDQLAQLANFNPDWDKLEAATDSLREHMAELTAARKRIAELSTSHSNLREAMAGIHNTITAGGAYTPLAAILNAFKAAYEESAAAAGKGEAS